MNAPATTRETAASPAVVRASIQTLASMARRLVAPGERRILGITGAPGAGKSTVASALAAELGSDAALVGMDGFHLANSELARLGRRDRKGAWDTFDAFGYAALLERLRTATETVYAPVFDRAIEESIGSAVGVDPSTPLIITEGNYLLLPESGWARAGSAIDQTWFLDVPTAVRAERLIRRRTGFGHSLDEATNWVEHVDLRNAALIDQTMGLADLVIELVEPAGETPAL